MRLATFGVSICHDGERDKEGEENRNGELPAVNEANTSVGQYERGERELAVRQDEVRSDVGPSRRPDEAKWNPLIDLMRSNDVRCRKKDDFDAKDCHTDISLYGEGARNVRGVELEGEGGEF
jgi:hypothetical protein